MVCCGVLWYTICMLDYGMVCYSLLQYVTHAIVYYSMPWYAMVMDRLPYRQKFLNDRNSKICYHSLKDHPKVSKIAKFRCEML